VNVLRTYQFTELELDKLERMYKHEDGLAMIQGQTLLALIDHARSWVELKQKTQKLVKTKPRFAHTK